MWNSTFLKRKQGSENLNKLILSASEDSKHFQDAESRSWNAKVLGQQDESQRIAEAEMVRREDVKRFHH
jgi:hypothetical protein